MSTATLTERFKEVETRLENVASRSAPGAVSPEDSRRIQQAAQQVDALSEELEALYVLGDGAAQDMAPILEQGLANLESELAAIEERTATGGD